MLEKDKIIILQPVATTNSIGEKILQYQDQGKYFKGDVQPNSDSIQIQMRGGVNTKSDKIYTTKTLPADIHKCHLLVNGEEYTIESISPWKGHFSKIITASEVK